MKNKKVDSYWYFDVSIVSLFYKYLRKKKFTSTNNVTFSISIKTH